MWDPSPWSYRLGNTKVGFDVNRLIYPKGGYILHMLRMMMWDPVNHDAAFKAMMHDYVQTYYNRVSSQRGFQRGSGTPHDPPS